MQKVKNILEGWKNLIWANPQVEEIAKTRLKECGECPKRSNYPQEVGLNSTCLMCGCVIDAKVRSMKSECPLKKWEAKKDDENI